MPHNKLNELLASGALGMSLRPEADSIQPHDQAQHDDE